jgi:hypothetical protein
MGCPAVCCLEQRAPVPQYLEKGGEDVTVSGLDDEVASKGTPANLEGGKPDRHSPILPSCLPLGNRS